jgi:tetratricopeptide (TPR) repeat protein
MTGVDDEQEIQRLLKIAKLAKAEAKDLRDDNDITDAIGILQRAIERLEKSQLAGKLDVHQPGEPVRRFAAQLADLLGMLGGNYRRAGELKLAQETFDRGKVYEQSTSLGVDSSYNLVNSITLPLESGKVSAVDLRNDLQRATEALERQVSGTRRTDRWAWADLAECRLLNGERDQAFKDYERVRDLGDEETIRSVVTVLERLANAVQTSDPATADNLDAAIKLLRK